MAHHRTEIHYGANSRLSLDFPKDSLVAEFTARRCKPLDDPAAAVAVALEHPIDFPPLKSAIFRGDKVAIAIDQDVPQIGSILAGVLHVLLGAGCDPVDITAVFATGSEENNRVAIPDGLRGHVRVEIHDPTDKTGLMYLASSKSQRPIYFNRTLGEADVVLPICTLRLAGSFGYFGTNAGLFPTFSDETSQKRFWERTSKQSARIDRRSEAMEAAWLLGVQFTLQITPGPSGSVFHVTAGETHAVARHAKTLCEQAWLCPIPHRATLVVASIEGDQGQQTWENWGRALYAASRAVEDRGAIVLCTDLRQPPGPAMQHLARIEDRELTVCTDSSDVALKRPRSAPDSRLATLLRRVRRRSQIYLLSGMDEDSVQQLGMAFVPCPEDIRTLSRRHRSCIVIENAQYALPTEL